MVSQATALGLWVFRFLGVSDFALLFLYDLLSHSCRQMTTIRVVGILALAAAAAAVGAALMRLKMNAELKVRQLRKTQRECPSDGPFVLLLHAGPG